MDKIHPPIKVTYADTIILTKIHYGDSDLINQLKILSFFANINSRIVYTSRLHWFQ